MGKNRRSARGERGAGDARARVGARARAPQGFQREVAARPPEASGRACGPLLRQCFLPPRPGPAAPPGREGGQPRRGGGLQAEPGECRLPARSPGSAPPERAREVRLCRAARPGDRGDLPARSPRSSHRCLPAWPVLRGRGRRGEHTWSAATPYLGDNSVTFQRVFSHLILANTFCHGKVPKPTASWRTELPPQAPGHRLPSLTAVQPSSCDAAQRARRFSGARAWNSCQARPPFVGSSPPVGTRGFSELVDPGGILVMIISSKGATSPEQSCWDEIKA
ncbi:uncharacterized protein [Kogia breviceps]|uniref:uncharacterized protein n=1 Tax=Kogia breviceps TaxID=27615 RepID=UPI0034D1B895